MQIDRFDIHHVSMPLTYPWRTGHGEDHAVHSVLVKATSGSYEAWAETTPLQMPEYSPECAGGIFYVLTEYMGPWVVGREYDTADELNDRLARFVGNPFAKAGLEMCWWTLQRESTETPLHHLLGGKTREVTAGADIQVQDTMDMLLQKVQEAVDEGFPRIKLKSRRGWDLEMMTTVRNHFPDTTFHMDFNSRYTIDDLPLFQALDKLELAFFEQPLSIENLMGLADLRQQVETPICLDESILSPLLMEQAIRLDACQYVNVKPGRVGGLANAVKIHDMCRDAGITTWVGGMLESALGEAICVELATLENFTYPGDIFPSSRFYSPDLCQPENTLTPRFTLEPFTGKLPVPDPELLAEQTVQQSAVLPGRDLYH